MMSGRIFLLRRIAPMLGFTLVLALATGDARVVDAQDQPICATHESIESFLDKRFSEQPTSLGIANTGALVEVFTSGEGQTWTIVVTRVDGRSCILAAGTDWYDLRVLADGPGV